MGTFNLPAQSFSSIATRYSDSFVHWEIFDYEYSDKSTDDTPEEIQVGEIKLRWLNLRDDWSEWDYELYDERGTIKMKWKNDPTHWELRSFDGNIVTIRAAWPNDPTEWRITNNSISLTLRSRWTNQSDEWLIDDPNRGRYYMYTFRQQDPRDWAVDDRLSEDVPRAMRVAAAFIVLFQTSPRR